MSEDNSSFSNIFRLDGEIIPQTLTDFRKKHDECIKQNADAMIIEINSPGGLVTSALGILQTMKDSPMTIVTSNVGRAYSAAACILAGGTLGLRYQSPTAFTMMHDVSSVQWGSFQDIEVSLDHVKELRDTLFNFVDSCTGYPPGTWLKRISLKNVDLWYNAEDAKKVKLIDVVALPNFSVEKTTTTAYTTKLNGGSLDPVLLSGRGSIT